MLGLAIAALFAYAQDCGHSSIEPASTEFQAPLPRELFPVFGEAARIGFIDRTGRVIVAPKFTRIGGEMAEALMAVSEPSGKESYLDSKGVVRVQTDGTLAGPFSEGLAAVKLGDKFGYIDMKGRVAIAPAFQQAGAFHLGLAAVRQKGRHGYVDRTGRFVIEPAFQWAGEFSESDRLAAVDYCGQCGYITAEGKPAFERRFWRCYRFAGGMAKVEVSQGKWAFVTARGEVFGDSDWARGFLSEGLVAVRSEGRGIGFMNVKGEWIIPPRFDDAAAFSDGKAAVRIGDKWGFIDKSGKLVIAPAYGDPAVFAGGLAFTSDPKSGKYGFINETGKWIIAPRFERCREEYGYNCGFHGALAQLETSTQMMYVNKSGKPVWTRSIRK